MAQDLHKAFLVEGRYPPEERGSRRRLEDALNRWSAREPEWYGEEDGGLYLEVVLWNGEAAEQLTAELRACGLRDVKVKGGAAANSRATA